MTTHDTVSITGTDGIIGVAGTGTPTLDEVAAEAGVSRSTASRALNGGSRVSPTAQAAVDAAAARLGYVANRAARSLVTRRTDSIALVVPEPDERVLTDPFIGATLRGVSAALAHTQLQLVLIMSRLDESASSVARYLRSGHVDGAVIASHHRDDSLEAAVASSPIPAVFVGRPFESARHLFYTDVDNIAAGRMAAQHLVGLGRSRIAHLSGPQDMAAGVDRLAGWRDALTEVSLPTDALVTADFSVAAGEAAMTTLLETHPDVDAVFAASDAIAIGAMRVLRAAGRRVPEDVAVIGYDDLGLAADALPPLTTMRNPVVEMASTAVEQLLAMLDRGERPAARGDVPPVVFPPRLVRRASA